MSTLELHAGPADLDKLAAEATGFSSGGSPAAGLPDVRVLARLANELFAAGPGGAPFGAQSLPGGLSPNPVPDAAGPPRVPSDEPALAQMALAIVGSLATGRGAPVEQTSGTSPGPGKPIPVKDMVALKSELPVHGEVGGSRSERPFAPITLPFESEIKALFHPLGDTRALPQPPVNNVSTFYFLEGLPGALNAGPSAELPQDAGLRAFDVQAIRRDFPILQERVNGRQLIWFDNAATTQKPRQVIERLTHFYEHENSNIHRAAHELAARATDAYEGARDKVAEFLNASSSKEIVFTRGATEAINLVAATYGAQHIGPGDEIVVTHLEHHANIVPWQQLALAKGAKLKVAPVDDRGALLLEELGRLLNSRTKLVAFTQVSNALGTITPAKAIVEMAHRVGAKVVIDGAQSVSHMAVDVQALDADFFVFSGHKLFAPTGIGALYGKKHLLDSLQPYQTGGNMIRDVTFESSEFHAAPSRFEAGTGNIADAVGLGAAIDYVQRIGLHNIARYEHALLDYATRKLSVIPGLRLIGQAPEKASVISLIVEGVPPEEVGKKLNGHGIAVRSGHHCAQPILRRFGLEATVRPSFAFYNTYAEIDVLVAALEDIVLERGVGRLHRA